MTGRFLLLVSLIYGSFACGIISRRLFPRLAGIDKPVTKILFIFFTGFITFNSVWSLELRRLSSVMLPAVNLGLILLTLPPAYLFARLLSLSPKKKGSFIACAIFSNWGTTLGGFLSFLLYGSRGLYFANWYIAFCRLYHYFIGVPLLGLYKENGKGSFGKAVGDIAHRPLWYFPFVMIAAGILLNILGVDRPRSVDFVATRVLIYFTVTGYSFSIGLGVKLQQSMKCLKAALFTALIKFIYNPLAAFVLLRVLGYFRQSDLLPAWVVMVESFMPTAIMSVVLVKLLGLDEDLANSAWFVTTICAVPVVLLLLRLFG
jgi:predicted permease